MYVIWDQRCLFIPAISTQLLLTKVIHMQQNINQQQNNYNHEISKQMDRSWKYTEWGHSER